jgi:hypothetical protein
MASPSFSPASPASPMHTSTPAHNNNMISIHLNFLHSPPPPRTNIPRVQILPPAPGGHDRVIFPLPPGPPSSTASFTTTTDSHPTARHARTRYHMLQPPHHPHIYTRRSQDTFSHITYGNHPGSFPPIPPSLSTSFSSSLSGGEAGLPPPAKAAPASSAPPPSPALAGRPIN